MIIVTGTARFGAGEIDRLQGPLAAYVDEVRGRDGCISYSYARDINDPDVLVVIEQWRDEAAIDAHMSDMGALMNALAGARMEGLSVKAYAADYQRTLMGE
jgi:quinol monooxygenase YgiN